MSKKHAHDLSAETSSTFEIVSAFIVSLYYNPFYLEAKRLHTAGSAGSVTEGYRAVIMTFIRTFDMPDTYPKIITRIHDYYRKNTRFRSISFSECINSISKHFIPPELYESADSRQRNGVMRRVLRDAVRKFSAKVISSDIIRSVIDDHNNTALPRMMQNVMFDALANERAEMFRKFFEGTHQTGDTKENFALVTKLKADIKRIEAAGAKVAEKSEGRRRDLMKALKALRGANEAAGVAKARVAELEARGRGAEARERGEADRLRAAAAAERERNTAAERYRAAIAEERARAEEERARAAEPRRIHFEIPEAPEPMIEPRFEPPRPPTPVGGGDDMFDIM